MDFSKSIDSLTKNNLGMTNFNLLKLPFQRNCLQVLSKGNGNPRPRHSLEGNPTPLIAHYEALLQVSVKGGMTHSSFPKSIHHLVYKRPASLSQAQSCYARLLRYTGSPRRALALNHRCRCCKMLGSCQVPQPPACQCSSLVIYWGFPAAALL